GFPVDLTNDVARERGLTLDSAGFEAAMQRQRERARAASQFSSAYRARIDMAAETEVIGYTETAGEARSVALLQSERPTEQLRTHEAGVVSRDRTPFYGESGGQVGDTGTIATPDERSVFRVTDTQKQDGVFLHFGHLEYGTLRPETAVHAVIDSERRHAIKL